MKEWSTIETSQWSEEFRGRSTDRRHEESVVIFGFVDCGAKS